MESWSSENTLGGIGGRVGRNEGQTDGQIYGIEGKSLHRTPRGYTRDAFGAGGVDAVVALGPRPVRPKLS